ncbi:MAG TPA: dihydrolipoyl dehydrogenase [Terriglobia bacterium]|nr:dihydrolipoyl dehydrogenase [Terriglobia bacterium]
MKNTNAFDLIVIGSGPGGYTAAVRASQLGMKTALVERDRLGGICLNWGCIPTKALLKNAEMLNLFRRSEEFGISYDNLRFDFSKIIQRSRGVADKSEKGVAFLMKKNNVATFTGSGKLAGKGMVEIYDASQKLKETISASRILLATGARARALPGIAFDGRRVISSTEAMILEQVPKSLLIIGAGAIGVEFAYFYNALGSKVTLVEMMPRILPIEDQEVADLLARSFKKSGIQILTESKVSRLNVADEGVEAAIQNAKGESSALKAELALMAVGVTGNVENLGLEQMGVKVEKGQVPVDGNFQTNVPGVYAIGDLIGPPWLAHVASAEAISAVEGMAELKERMKVDYDNIPGCTYCQPQVASIGLTEQKAREKGHELKIGKFPFSASGKGRAIGETEGLVKLIFDAKYGELLGAHILGSEATEMIAELGIAKNLEATCEEILKTVHAHPTLSEAVMEAAASAAGEAINI